MIPPKVPIKGPQGKDDEAGILKHGAEFQEHYEERNERPDLVGGDPTQDPTSLKAPDSDHTPNTTKGPKSAKPNYGKFEGRGNGGVGL